jgi:hypothetical protein
MYLVVAVMLGLFSFMFSRMYLDEADDVYRPSVFLVDALSIIVVATGVFLLLT